MVWDSRLETTELLSRIVVLHNLTRGCGKSARSLSVPLTMSRLTSAQVISLGEYLAPDFDPSSLTVSQLLGVLGYHNIRYPTPYTKTKLLQVFNAEIKTRASKFKKERLKKEKSIASDDGITDGLTGEPLNKGKVRSLKVPVSETLTCIQGQGRARSQAIIAPPFSAPIYRRDFANTSRSRKYEASLLQSLSHA